MFMADSLCNVAVKQGMLNLVVICPRRLQCLLCLMLGAASLGSNGRQLQRPFNCCASSFSTFCSCCTYSACIVLFRVDQALRVSASSFSTLLQ